MGTLYKPSDEDYSVTGYNEICSPDVSLRNFSDVRRERKLFEYIRLLPCIGVYDDQNEKIPFRRGIIQSREERQKLETNRTTRSTTKTSFANLN